jgi:catechol 2,3-dioxygenase-like lactoylglutathione lyase family enzyme
MSLETAPTPSQPAAPKSALGWDGGLTCALQVKDLHASLAWYRDVLGFEPLYVAEDIAWSELTTGVARVTVGLSQTETGGGSGGATLTFGVKDIAAAQAVLAAKGVPTDGDIQHIPGMVMLLTFYDPDGNVLMLYQDMSKST